MICAILGGRDAYETSRLLIERAAAPRRLAAGSTCGIAHRTGTATISTWRTVEERRQIPKSSRPSPPISPNPAPGAALHSRRQPGEAEWSEVKRTTGSIWSNVGGPRCLRPRDRGAGPALDQTRDRLALDQQAEGGGRIFIGAVQGRARGPGGRPGRTSPSRSSTGPRRRPAAPDGRGGRVVRSAHRRTPTSTWAATSRRSRSPPSLRRSGSWGDGREGRDPFRRSQGSSGRRPSGTSGRRRGELLSP